MRQSPAYWESVEVASRTFTLANRDFRFSVSEPQRKRFISVSMTVRGHCFRCKELGMVTRHGPSARNFYCDSCASEGC